MKELTFLQILMLETEMKEIGQAIMELHKTYRTTLKEASEAPYQTQVADFVNNSDDPSYIFDEAKKRYLAAKRAFGIVNKLPNPEERQRHYKMIMINLNKLRAIYNRLQNTVTQEVDAIRAKMQKKQTQRTNLLPPKNDVTNNAPPQNNDQTQQQQGVPA
jgi:hypothetical protein